MFRNEAAMAAVLGVNKPNRWVFVDLRSQEGRVRHEWIILRGDQQHRHADLSRDAFRPHVFVIVLRIVITKLRRGDQIIKFAHGANRPQAIELVTPRKHLLFSCVARH